MRRMHGRGAFSGIIKESVDYFSDYNKEDLILKIEPVARLVCSKIYKFWKEHYNESRAVSKDNIKHVVWHGLNFTQIKGLTDSYKAFEESLGIYGSIIKIYADEVSGMDERSLKSIFLETDETGRNFFYLSISGIKAFTNTESADERNEIYNQCCSEEIPGHLRYLTRIDKSGKMLEKFVNAFFYGNLSAELRRICNGNAFVTAEQSPFIPFKYKKLLVVKWSYIEIMFSHAAYILHEYKKIKYRDDESLEMSKEAYRNPQKEMEDYYRFLHTISHELIHFLQNSETYYNKNNDTYDITSENEILNNFFYALSNSEIDAEFASFKQDIIRKIRQNDLKLISLINLRNRILCRYYFLTNFEKMNALLHICIYLLMSCFSPDDLEKDLLHSILLYSEDNIIDNIPEFSSLMDSMFKHKTKAKIIKIFSNDINTKLLPNSTSGLKDHLDIVMYFIRFCTNLLYYYEKKFLNILYNNFPDDYSGIDPKTEQNYENLIGDLMEEIEEDLRGNVRDKIFVIQMLKTYSENPENPVFDKIIWFNSYNSFFDKLTKSEYFNQASVLYLKSFFMINLFLIGANGCDKNCNVVTSDYFWSYDYKDTSIYFLEDTFILKKYNRLDFKNVNIIKWPKQIFTNGTNDTKYLRFNNIQTENGILPVEIGPLAPGTLDIIDLEIFNCNFKSILKVNADSVTIERCPFESFLKKSNIKNLTIKECNGSISLSNASIRELVINNCDLKNLVLPDGIKCITINNSPTHVLQGVSVEKLSIKDDTDYIPGGITVKELEISSWSNVSYLPSDLTVLEGGYIHISFNMSTSVKYNYNKPLRDFLDKYGIKYTEDGISAQEWMSKRHLIAQKTTNQSEQNPVKSAADR